MSWEHALRIASQIHDPVSVAAFVSVLAIIAFLTALRAKRPINKWILGILAVGIFILALAPLAASAFLKSRGIYRIRVVVLGLDKSPVEDARVSSSSGGEPKRVEGGWEFDIPLQTLPADGKEVLMASVKNAFLTGSSAVVLGEDYYPTTTIQLTSDTSATIRGVVVDEQGRSVPGATVSIPGYAERAQTDNMGNFVLPAHAADGQMVQVRAQKGRLGGDISGPAGRGSVTIIVRRP
jgi:hypothetical protein